MNIEDYEFSDKQVLLERITNKHCVWLMINNNDKEMFISKFDVIALAKHFKLTANDLIGE